MQERDMKIKQIELLKQRLNKLIIEKNFILDEEVLEISKMLDLILNEYSELLKKEY